MRLLPVPPALPAIDALLAEDGGARVAGGAVRDLLLGRVPKDIDLATPAMPEQVLARAAAAGLRTIPTGLQHGTVTVVLPHGEAVEITTLRADVPGAPRAAAPRLGAGWAEDAARRDLTINALFLDARGRIHDHVGGVADLEARRVRFVGDPAARLAEDPLRALRFFRAAARLGEARLDPLGRAACPGARLDAVAPERRWSEAKALLAARPATDLLDAAGPTLARAGLPRLRPDAAAAAAAGADPTAVWGQALPDAAGAERFAAAFRLSRAEAKILHLAATVRDPERLPVLARLGTPLDALAALAPALGAPAPKDGPDGFPLAAADLRARGLQDGPAMGQALAALRRRWAEDGGRPDGPALLAALGRAEDGLSGREAPRAPRPSPRPGSQDPCR